MKLQESLWTTIERDEIDVLGEMKEMKAKKGKKQSARKTIISFLCAFPGKKEPFPHWDWFFNHVKARFVVVVPHADHFNFTMPLECLLPLFLVVFDRYIILVPEAASWTFKNKGLNDVLEYFVAVSLL